MTIDSKELVSGYAVDRLSEEERRRLFEAALDDQDLFDELVEEEVWRRVFTAPGAREQLLAALEPPAGRPRRFLTLPRLAMAGGVLTAALTLVLLMPENQVELASHDLRAAAPRPAADSLAKAPAHTEEPVVKGLRDRTASEVPVLADHTPTRNAARQRTVTAVLEVDTVGGVREVDAIDRLRPGDGIRVRLVTDFEAWVYLLNRSQEEPSYVLLFPDTPAEHRPRRGDFVVPDGWLEIDATPADEELVVVVSSEPSFDFERSASPSQIDLDLRIATARFEALERRREVDGGRVRWIATDAGDGVTFVLRI